MVLSRQCLRVMGFNDNWVDMVWRLISNIWYSININSARKGFFNSYRGLRQGNPLSPSLFIIRADMLSRMMNNLANNDDFIPYFMDKGPIITHLSYADNTMLFISGDLESIRLMMRNLATYEQASGQVNFLSSTLLRTHCKSMSWKGK
ncbi:uncharacterized protein LOC132037474 [Lycium ferocissimum]|uniref:uncharacterized protein LOC132037474 n=1 Tax=Lycium ferocissimum TaxID=112874 RepID=UPI0028160173|nr:uncharacterized protein LOC132037474 [Lycium ferocissimum]